MRGDEKLNDKLEQIAIPAGGVTSVGLTTLPLWVQNMSAWAAAVSPIIGVVVGVLTAYLLVLKIMQRHKR